MSVRRSRNEIPTIDVNLVTISVTKMVEGQSVVDEFGFDTANQIEVEAQTEDEEAVLVNKQGYERYEWLDRKMFDYRGLIPRGLALETPEETYEHEAKSDVNESGSRIGVGCKIRSKENPDIILSIISDDCHGDEFECSNGSVLSLKQIKKHYDLYIEENKGTIGIN